MTLNSLGLTPTMPRSAMRAATVLWLTALAGLVQVGGDPGRPVGAARGLVEADDLGVQVASADLAGQRRAVLGCSPAVVARRWRPPTAGPCG